MAESKESKSEGKSDTGVATLADSCDRMLAWTEHADFSICPAGAQREAAAVLRVVKEQIDGWEKEHQDTWMEVARETLADERSANDAQNVLGFFEMLRAIRIVCARFAARSEGTQGGAGAAKGRAIPRTPAMQALERGVRTLPTNRRANAEAALSTLLKVFQKILEVPDDPKFQSLRLGNKNINKKIVQVEGAVDFLIGTHTHTHQAGGRGGD